MILFLFLSHLGVGIAFTLALVSREAGVKFFRFNAGLAASLIAIALAFRYQDLQSSPPRGGARSGLAEAGLLALVVCVAATIFYWATVGRMLARIRTAIAAVAVIGGLNSLSLQVFAISAIGGDAI